MLSQSIGSFGSLFSPAGGIQSSNVPYSQGQGQNSLNQGLNQNQALNQGQYQGISQGTNQGIRGQNQRPGQGGNSTLRKSVFMEHSNHGTIFIIILMEEFL